MNTEHALAYWRADANARLERHSSGLGACRVEDGPQEPHHPGKSYSEDDVKAANQVRGMIGCARIREQARGATRLR